MITLKKHGEIDVRLPHLLLTYAEVADLMGMSVNTFRKKRKQLGFPEPIPNTHKFSAIAVINWMPGYEAKPAPKSRAIEALEKLDL